MPLLMPLPLPTLTTPRLRLRPLGPQDVDDLFTVYGDPEVMRYASDGPFPAPATVLQMLASVDRLLARGESLEWGVVQPPDPRVIGSCGLHGFEPLARSAQLGCLLARAHWGQGLMAEALLALMGLARGTLGLQRLHAEIDAPNLRSLRLFQRLGFVPAVPPPNNPPGVCWLQCPL